MARRIPRHQARDNLEVFEPRNARGRCSAWMPRNPRVRSFRNRRPRPNCWWGRCSRIDPAAGTIEIGFTADERFLNPAGTVQGGLPRGNARRHAGLALFGMTHGEAYAPNHRLHDQLPQSRAARPVRRQGPRCQPRQDHRLHRGRIVQRLWGNRRPRDLHLPSHAGRRGAGPHLMRKTETPEGRSVPLAARRRASAPCASANC